MSSGEEIAYDFIISALAVFLVILVMFLLFSCRKKPVESVESLSARISAQAYPLVDIEAATDGFNSRRVIGKGRLGTVYAAALLGGEEVVAVKRMHPSLVLRNAGFRFSSIIKSLSLAQHPSIVSILGYTQAPGERIIIMEFVGMLSLDFYLHEAPDRASLLTWNHRIRIAAAAARGLEYLHQGTAPNVVHGCFKTSNVLLDEKVFARVCDYGMSSFAPMGKSGLLGYVDDEYWINGGCGACKESDVYGFGVVLLELLTGRRAEEGLLVRWALPLIKELKFNEVLDPRIAMPSNVKPIIRLAKVASACVGNSRRNRPTIVQVAAILNSLEMEVSLSQSSLVM